MAEAGIRLENLASAVGARLIGERRARATGFSLDSRFLQPGELFFALRGEKRDGHDFVAAALKAGAAGAVVARLAQEILPGPGQAFLVVEDTRKALQEMAAWWRGLRDLPVLAVTGSSGKTTTKDMLAAVLASRWKVLKSKGNYNNELGLPFTLLELRPEHGVVVLEMGMRGPGQIAELCALARPTAGIITNIGTAHYEFLGSRENIALAKGELLQALPLEGFALLNADDPFCRQLAGLCRGRVVLYGLSASAGVRGEEVRLLPAGSSFYVALDGEREEFSLPVPGRHNVLNALAAIAAGHMLGLSLAQCARGLAGLVLNGMRLEEVPGPHGSLFLNDAYNANPDSMKASLEVMAGLEKGRGIAVLGEMLELGSLAEEEHLEVGRAAARAGVAWLITVGGHLAGRIAEGAREAGLPPGRVASFAGREEAAEFLRALLIPGDVVLFKASRAIALDRMISLLKQE